MRKSKGLALALAGLIGANAVNISASYLDAQAYREAVQGIYQEDRGIVVENEPMLGYLTYRNASGRTITANYYSAQMTVEKQPYYEQEDRIGYIDELFPSFSYDPRDTTISQIKPGDNIYLHLDKDQNITYISAYNDYVVRYGKVQSLNLGGQNIGTLTLLDDYGRVYTYGVALDVAISKRGTNYSLAQLKNGEWVKLLVAQKILGEGIVEEELVEITVDADTRVISDIYVGTLIGANVYNGTLSLRDGQTLAKAGWGPYNDLVNLSADSRTVEAYVSGNRTSWDYMVRNLSRGGGVVYAAIEQFMGKTSAVKLNFQSQMQRTLPASQVIYSTPGTIRLLSGETLHLAADSIVVKDKRLVDASSIMVGDMVQAVVTGVEKVAVANILPAQTTGSLQIFRGRIKRIATRQTFEVETFSLLEEHLWYFHPSPRTFSLGSYTRFFTEEGLVPKGIEDFLSYGVDSKVDDVYTIIAIGDEARYVVDMPYTRESVTGEVYAVASDAVKIKDVYYYHQNQKRWVQHSRANYGVDLSIAPNTLVIKNGEVIPASKLEVGDKLTVMTKENLRDVAIANGQAENVSLDAYVLVVKE
jgi:hypothetical protein